MSCVYQTVCLIQSRELKTIDTSQCRLALHIAPEEVKVSALDPYSKQCLLLATYLGCPKTILADHPMLQFSKWGSVNVCLQHDYYTIVPAPLWDPKYAKIYLQTVCPIDKKLPIYNYIYKPLEIIFVFNTPIDLSNHYITHQAHLQIDYALTYIKKKDNKIQKDNKTQKYDKRIFVDIDLTHLYITILDNDTLYYYNQFLEQDPEKQLYYLLTVMQTLSLAPTHHKVIFNKRITNNNPLVKLAQQYIRYIYLDSRQDLNIKFGYKFGDKAVLEHLDVLKLLDTVL